MRTGRKDSGFFNLGATYMKTNCISLEKPKTFYYLQAKFTLKNPFTCSLCFTKNVKNATITTSKIKNYY